MTSAELQAQVSAAKAYEALFVPALFAQWTSKVADAAKLSTGQRVLDVGCGTGVLAAEAKRRTGPSGSVVGLDAGAGMLAVAQEMRPEVEWQQGTAESLPFPDATFDAVVSQFCLMFTDRDRAIREMLRVLKPDGQLAVAVWDNVQNIPAYADLIGLVERVAGKRPADALRAPFALGDRAMLDTLFEAAGAGSFAIATPEGTARFPSIRVMAEADLRGWLPLVGVHLEEEVIGRILAEAEDALARYVVEGGRVEFPAAAHIVTAMPSSRTATARG